MALGFEPTRPSERESPPITTRPGLPPNEKYIVHILIILWIKHVRLQSVYLVQCAALLMLPRSNAPSLLLIEFEPDFH